MTPTVGFDLDLTLVDPRPGVRAVLARLSAERDLPIDVELWLSRLGQPLEDELSHWVPADEVAATADRYREIYAEDGVHQVRALPGAREAVAAVRADGGRVVVITAKKEDFARSNLDFLGIEVDDVRGWRWGDGKVSALLEQGAGVYVGDHPADMAAARTAGAVAVGVATGGTPPSGADTRLADLTEFPAWWSGHLLQHRLERLDEQLRTVDSLAVAYSGGADSAFLLAAAVRALGTDRVVAVTGLSPSLAAAELPKAAAFAASLGVRHLTPTTDELSRSGYTANGPDRCFHCKATLLDTLRPLAAGLGLAAVATGTNADDLAARFRPGIAAARERGALTPLADAGLTKDQVRAASRLWGLPTADKPALACLASRIAYGVSVTPVALARVDRAENALRAHLGPSVRDLRVRDLGEGRARVELDRAALRIFDEEGTRLVLASGFTAVTVEPFRSGSLNDLLAPARQGA